MPNELSSASMNKSLSINEAFFLLGYLLFPVCTNKFHLYHLVDLIIFFCSFEFLTEGYVFEDSTKIDKLLVIYIPLSRYKVIIYLFLIMVIEKT